MPRITKIYTRQGDDGTTFLGSKTKVPKDAQRVLTYGTVDELNSTIGVAIALGLADPLNKMLPTIQNELFHLGAELSFPEEEGGEYAIPRIENGHVDNLEKIIDKLNEIVGALDNFILPGGAPTSASLHVARTVCRRAEREVVTLAREETIGKYVLPYLNRLSDALFVMARYENHQRGVAEPLWDSRA
jgi:cob(I)alamin adenosyltransferase